MISNSNSKFIKSLQIKKFRVQHNSFIVQGAKNILELLDSEFEIIDIYLTDNIVVRDEWKPYLSTLDYTLCKQQDIERHSTFKSNSDGLAIVKIPDSTELSIENEYVIVLDGISDPGNLGTIIRIADWYGIKKIVCSSNCVDWYNPKVINSTMGSFTRVNSFYTDLSQYFKKHNNEKVIGALLNGANLHQTTLPNKGFILIGSESHGISQPLMDHISNPVTIPKFGGAESLNAGIAAAVICDNLLRVINN